MAAGVNAMPAITSVAERIFTVITETFGAEVPFLV
jgi:hypothetical protein